MTKYATHKLLERQQNAQKKLLYETGWDHIMWRWYWVWHKKTHDCEFNCMTMEQAIFTQKALEETDDYFKEKKDA